MKILLLNPPFFPKFSRSQRSPGVIRSGTLYYPLWLAYATGVLENSGFKTSLIDAPARGLNLQTVLQEINNFSPQLLVMDTSTPSIHTDISTAETIKKEHPELFIIMVGTHVSATAEETLTASTAINAIARHEYDYTLRHLAKILDKKKNLNVVDGISYREKGTIIHNPDREWINDLDNIPFVSTIYKKHLRIEDYFYSITQHPQVTIITGRGCPHQCTYCVYPQTMFGHKYRSRSIKNVVDEFCYIKQEFPHVKEIFLEDDTMTLNKKRCKEFSEQLTASGSTIHWTANSRADVDLETLQSMKKAGCRLLCIGVESGDQNILNGIQKGIKLDRILQFVKDAKRAGILIHGCFMVGNAGETKETMKKTLEFAKKLSPDTAQFFPLMVYPGTKAYEWTKANQYLTTENYSEWVTKEGLHNCVISTPDLSNTELVEFCDYARKSFYLRPMYIASKCKQIIINPKEARRILKSSKTFFKHLLQGNKKNSC